MCGIAGIFSATPRAMGVTLGRMTDNLAHRGPDGQGFASLSPGFPRPEPAAVVPPTGEARVFLGHRRLAIIDLAGSAQPLRNEDGSVWLVFNGEIYNFRELAGELAAKGHVLREKGDTEVLVHLYEEYGPDMAARLNGMFALAIYDTRTDTLFLARDRYGEKPLFYFEAGGLFAFASELQGLWPVPGFPFDAVDAVAAAQYFRYGYVPSPHTIHTGVSCLPAGHVLTRQGGRTHVSAYWRPRVTAGDPAMDVAELGALVDEAVRSRLVADVPVACFLSGGIDSSLIAASMRALGPVDTFTIATGGPDDESVVARETARVLGTNHHEYRVEPEFTAIAARLARHYGQPFADYSCVPTYYVCRETARSVKVALSGDGGDELFAGYDRYANLRLAGLVGLGGPLARSVLPRLAGLVAGPGDGRYQLRDFLASARSYPAKGENASSCFHEAWRRAVFTDVLRRADAAAHTARFGALYAEAAGNTALERCLETDQRMYLPDDILAKVDIAAMAVSLETRAPFLDHRLAERVNALPDEQKLMGRKTKLLLRALARRRLPSALAELPKRGFSLPLASWLRGDLAAFARDTLLGAPDLYADYLRPAAVACMLDDHLSGAADHALRLWMVISWCLWRRALPGAGERAA
jgi:asparagine synthase (glutamine-hydrolysing)